MTRHIMPFQVVVVSKPLETMLTLSLPQSLVMRNSMSLQGLPVLKSLRADFIKLLESVVNYRNYIAHELLANQIIMEGLIKDYSGRFEFRELQHGIYELEQIALFYDWCQENNSWD